MWSRDTGLLICIFIPRWRKSGQMGSNQSFSIFDCPWPSLLQRIVTFAATKQFHIFLGKKLPYLVLAYTVCLCNILPE